MNDFARSAILAIWAFSLVACRNGHDSPSVESFITFLNEDSSPALRRDIKGTECDSLFLSHVGFSQMGEECSRRTGESLLYSYTGYAGTILIRGKRVGISAERVSPLFVSVRDAISAHFGSATNCRTYDLTDPYYSRLYIWHQRSRTFLLKKSVLNDTSVLLPGVTLESSNSSRTCGMMAGGPQPRL